MALLDVKFSEYRIMPDDFLTASRSLSLNEKRMALANLLEFSGDPEAGIIRQLLGDKKKPLSKKQQYVFHNKIEPSLVEKCGCNGCVNFVIAGTSYCPSCNLEYGSIS